MGIFVWNDSYSVKVAVCDAQHQKLFETMNELADAMKNRKGQETLSKTACDLLVYTKTHFRDEEALLRMAKYPALVEHERQHQGFVDRVEKLADDLLKKRPTNAVQVLTFLQDWLTNHIRKSDRAYSGHLNTYGIR